MSDPDAWPTLPYADWTSTREALHRWTQIVGKIRVAQEPWLNHSWHVGLYVSARGLQSGPIPCGRQILDAEFDFVDQTLRFRTSSGASNEVKLRTQSVAGFFAGVQAALAALGLDIAIDGRPNEIPDATPFAQDTEIRDYDPEAARRFWRALVQADRVFRAFRTAFLGKASPVHFFWGSFDLAVSRFSGRRAPLHPGGVPALPDAVAQEAYSHEVSSAGFWPGGGGVDYAAFYSYAYPAPEGFADGKLSPPEAFFHKGLGEFVLPYDAVRQAADPDGTLRAFLQGAYDLAADLGRWDRAALECEPGTPRRPRPVAP